jgi:hypothetical protein
MKSILVHLPAYSKVRKFKHGGVQRSNQIRESLAKELKGYICLDVFDNVRSDVLKSLIYLPIVLYRLRNSGLDFTGFIIGCVLFKRIKKYLSPKINNLFILEGAEEAQLIVALLVKACHKEYITFPHNIDGMTPGFDTYRFMSKSDRFALEISIYMGATWNFAISGFDAAIIRSLSAKASIYPFYPGEDKLQFVQKIGIARHDCDHNEIIILGTVLNPPTRMAFETLLLQIQKDKLVKYTFNVVGFGTEMFSEFNSPNLKIYGSVSDEILNHLLINARCALIPVIQTTGFLTKLVELNLENIPVVLIGQYYQARDLEEYGIYQTETIAEVYDIIKTIKYPSKKFKEPSFLTSALATPIQNE